MNLFPLGPISLDFAEARLERVFRARDGALARYGILPVQVDRYAEVMRVIQPHLGLRYPAMEGMWASFMVSPEQDAIGFVVGIDEAWGRSLFSAHRALGDAPKSLVPDFQVRAMARGFLARMGVA